MKVIFMWKAMELSCRMSIAPKWAREFCKRMEVAFNNDLVYTNTRYRELHDKKPRVDCEDLLLHVANLLGVKPDEV